MQEGNRPPGNLQRANLQRGRPLRPPPPLSLGKRPPLMPSTDASTRSLPTLHEFFAPGGILARSPLPYEYRPGQLQMAKAVEQALAERRHLIVEAGTGTGKTLAYLLPALRTGRRVIVSTGTKALQDQLYFRDVPFLETLLGELRVCYMKGRANYLCRHKLFALRDQPVLSGLEEIDQYRQIAEWEKTTETGDRAELSGMPESSALWQQARRPLRRLPRHHLPRLPPLLHHRDAPPRPRVRHHHRQPPPLLCRSRRQARGRRRARRRRSARGRRRRFRRSPRARRSRLQLLRPLGLEHPL